MDENGKLSRKTEVNGIKRQKFLTELNRLLTFMNEGDRQEVMVMYLAMFEDARDDDELSAMLVSPTRQAVLNARAYRADAAEEDERPHIAAVRSVRKQAVLKGIIGGAPAPAAPPAPPVEQFSFFRPEPEEITPAPEDTENEAPAPEEPEEIVPVEEGQISLFGEEGLTEAPAETTEGEDEFILDDEDGGEGHTVRRARVPLLILFVLLAVPLTLAGLLVLLVPAFGCLAAAGLLGAAGVVCVSSALGGAFSMVANLLVMLGVGIVLFALGLLFLWAFVWFIGGVMVSLVSAVITLGRRWCFKEVQTA